MDLDHASVRAGFGLRLVGGLTNAKANSHAELIQDDDRRHKLQLELLSELSSDRNAQD